MAVMALELAASRLYAPYFGSSIHVWAGLIGALLFFLAAGNYLGGWLSRRGSGLRTLYGLVIVAAVYGAFSPYIAVPVMRWFSVAAGTGGNMLPGILVTTLSALALPLVMLGCVLPLATGELTREASDAGRTAGTLYALSTVGSITGVFLPALVTLPELGTRLTFVVFSLAAGAAAAAGLAKSRYFVFLLVFIPAWLLEGGTPLRAPQAGEELLAEVETPYNYIQITKSGSQVKMKVDQGWLTYSKYRPGEVRTYSYRDYFPLASLLNGAEGFPRSVCILGLAGGADARVIRHTFPWARITGVEIDPDIIDMGRKYMGLDHAEIDRMVIADGRSFLRNSDDEFDLIIVDVYNQAYIPFHMATVEFFELARKRLAPGGIVAMNVAWRSAREWLLPERIANTLKEVFPDVYIQMFTRKSNTLLYASERQVDFKEFSDRFKNPRNQYVRSLVREGLDMFQPYEGEGMIFVDDRAPVELYTDTTIKNFFNSDIEETR